MKSRLVPIVIMLAAFASSTYYIYQYNFARSLEKLPFYGQIQDFRLQKSDHQFVTRDDLKGKVWVADFIFTTCSGICPMMTKNLARVQKLFHADEDLLLVSISVNPDSDTPDVLDQYAKKVQADTSQWYFLTGALEDIKKLAVESFKLGAIDEPVFHSSYLTLVDRQGTIRGYYDGTNEDKVHQLIDDIRTLHRER